MIRALALGARAVLVGRPLLYGVTAWGEPGADRAMQILQDELVRSMQLCGAASIADITPDLIHRHFPQFAPRHVDGESELISQAEVKLYAQGEEIAREGESLAGLNLILRGHAMISVRDRAGVSREVARLGEGEYFGEQSILGTQASEVTVTAEEDLQVLVLDSGTLSLLLSQMPRLGREIGGLLDIRRKAAQSVRRHKPLARGEAGAPLPTGAAEVGSNGTDGSVP